MITPEEKADVKTALIAAIEAMDRDEPISIIFLHDNDETVAIRAIVDRLSPFDMVAHLKNITRNLEKHAMEKIGLLPREEE